MSWPLGVTTGGCMETPILEVLDAIEAAGFGLIEIGTPPHHFDLWSHEQLKVVAQRLGRSRMKAVSIHAPFGGNLELSDPEPVNRTRAIRSVLQAATVIRELGGRIVVVHPTDIPRHGSDVGPRLDTCVESLDLLVHSLARMDLMLALESPLPHLIGGDPEEFEWILQRVDDIKVCLDTGHVTLGGYWNRFLSLAGSRLIHVHADDHRGSYDDHLPPGDGILPWAEIAETLRASGFRGSVVLELSCPQEPLAAYFSRARESAELLLGNGAARPAPSSSFQM